MPNSIPPTPVRRHSNRSRNIWSVSARVGITLALALSFAPLAAAQYSESFESYANGSAIEGQGGFINWSGVNSNLAVVSTDQANSGSQSLQSMASSDTVQPLSGVTSGVWSVSAEVYVPSNTGGKRWFVLMNEFNVGGPWEWGAEMAFNSDTGQVECNCGGGTPALAALVFDAWTEVRYEVDLDGDSVDAYYNGALLATYPWSGGATGAGSFANLAVEAIDLYSEPNSTGEVYWDDLRVTPLSTQPTYFKGLLHEELGDAELDGSVPGQLRVSNLGSSGLDGVCIYPGEVEYVVIDFQPSPVSTLPAGAYVETVGRGELNGVPDQEIMTVRTTVQPGSTEVGVFLESSALGAGGLIVEARLNGAVVATDSYATAPSDAVKVACFPPWGCQQDPVWPMSDEVWALVGVEQPVPTTLPGQAPVMADQVVLRRATTSDVGPRSELDVRAANVPEIILTNEQVGMFGTEHTALGEAQLLGVGGTLSVSNLGSSGLDGVRMNGSLLGGGFSLDGIPSALPFGALLISSTTGTIAGASGVEFGSIVREQTATALEYWPDYSALGITSYTVSVYSGQTLQDSASGLSGMVASVATPPRKILHSSPWFVSGPECGEDCWPFGVQFDVPGLGAVTGDRLVIMPDNGPLADSVETVELRTAGITDYTITNTTVVTDDGTFTNYCGPANPNSTGQSATISATGSALVAANNLTLTASNMPANQFGYFVASTNQGFVPNVGGSQGNLCLGSGTVRFIAQVANSGPSGEFSIPVDLTAIPSTPPVAVLPGENWNFQAWFRDVGGTSNFTDGVTITFE